MKIPRFVFNPNLKPPSAGLRIAKNAVKVYSVLMEETICSVF
jgi:hypothetical protein